MLSQEIIYQHLQANNYTDIITLLQEYGNVLHQDVTVDRAIDIAMEEFFKYIKTASSEDLRELNHDLDILLLCHKQKKFILKSHHLLQLIHLLYPRVEVQYLYDVAKEFPNDDFCYKICDKHEKQKKLAKTIDNIYVPPNLASTESLIPGQKFSMEINGKDGNAWIKVYLRSNDLLDITASHIRKLQSVDRVNITPKGNHSDLTIYARKPFTVKEAKEEVELTLENYFSRTPADPIFKEEVLSGISDIAYFQILDYIIKLGIGLEGFRDLASKMNEERYRDYFVNYLDSLSNNHTATGETFHGAGKADILIRNQKKEVLLVAECKIWTGPSNLSKAIDQLFERYIAWRDGKAALIIFNTKASNFSKIIETSVETVKAHRLCINFDGRRSETSYSYTFRNHLDESKTIKLELILFNFV